MKQQKCKTLEPCFGVLSVPARQTQLAWNSTQIVSLEKSFTSDYSRVKKKHHTSNSGRKTAKKVEKISLQNFFLLLMDSRRRPVRPDRQTQCKHSENMCKFMPQCFQIWQVSAKYCTFLDFLPIVMPIVHESLRKHPPTRTKFWVTQ